VYSFASMVMPPTGDAVGPGEIVGVVDCDGDELADVLAEAVALGLVETGGVDDGLPGVAVGVPSGLVVGAPDEGVDAGDGVGGTTVGDADGVVEPHAAAMSATSSMAPILPRTRRTEGGRCRRAS
jgi:hypothetical protein